MTIDTLLLCAAAAGSAFAFFRAYRAARAEVAALKASLRQALSRLDAARERAGQLALEVARVSKAAESYRAEVEPLKALSDGLGRQLAAMGKKR